MSHPLKSGASVARLHSLDGLRGAAALAVVVFHWQHFLFQGTALGAIDPARLPFATALQPLYRYGWSAVDLFFVLSGFVFHWLYREKVASGRIGGRAFAMLRFSRLYPLHLATLLLVAAMQLHFLHRTGSYFVYVYNDLEHFLLQLGLASGWGFEQGHSFNAPVSSVSVEVVLYAIFFLVSRYLRLHIATLVLASLLIHVLTPRWTISSGLFGFFLGGAAYAAFEACMDIGRSWCVAIVCAAAGAWIATLALSYDSAPWLTSALPTTAKMVWLRFVLFPLTVLSFALAECRLGLSIPGWPFLGKISYSSYLLHFPLQLAAVSVLGSGMIFLTPWGMAAFFVILIPLAWACFELFELPVQDALRARFPPSRA